MWKLFLALCFFVVTACQARPPNTEPREISPPLSVEALRERQFNTTLTDEGGLPDGMSFRAQLVSYAHSGLKLYAMVATPKSEPPAGGFPVIIANHGYVPNPKRYGMTEGGEDWRPGDYYRSVPELFTSRGFLVVLPDYRGHNSSDGFEYIDPQGDHSVAYYAEDVVALMSTLDALDDADLDNVFMWSHSMGGPVSMRAILATDIVKAAAFWSTMDVDDLTASFGRVDVPAIIHHSMADTATSHSNSERMAATLNHLNRSPVFHSYEGGNHFFDSRDREIAADRDAEFFRDSSSIDGAPQ